MTLNKIKNFFLKIRTVEIIFGSVIALSVVATYITLGFSAEKIGGLIIFFAVMMYLARIMIKIYFPEDFAASKDILIVETLVAVMVFFMLILKFNSAVSLYFLPIGAAGILMAVLVPNSIAVIGSLITSMVAVSLAEFRFELFMLYFSSCLAGAYAARKIRNRRELNRSGLYILAVEILLIGSFGFITGKSIINIGINIAWGAGAAFVSVIIAAGLLPFYENIFKVTTDIKLLELGDFNQPLLKRLMLEAPGTYHHSLMVGNLAEHACEQIGANPLLARVSAYYHDIGKLKNPQYFIENQSDKGNKHDKLKSNISALILKRHVKDGVKLAEEHNLDSSIVEAIQQHHGTTLMKYFYNKVLNETDDKTSIDKDEFRYPGPRPGTKEGGVIMLADTVEAACRTLEDPSFSRISALVTKLINNKFIDNQLNRCEITLANLGQIQKSFINTLSGIYHSRIEYPEDKEETAVEE